MDKSKFCRIINGFLKFLFSFKAWGLCILFFFCFVFCPYECHSTYFLIYSVFKNKYIICLKVIPCFQRDGLFCLHENGCITLRVRRSYNSVFTTSNEEPGECISHNNVKYVLLQNYFIKLPVASTSQSIELMTVFALRK